MFHNENRPEGELDYIHTQMINQHKLDIIATFRKYEAFQILRWLKRIFSDFYSLFSVLRGPWEGCNVNWETIANQRLAPKVNSTHSGRGVDVACVVSNLERAEQPLAAMEVSNGMVSWFWVQGHFAG